MRASEYWLFGLFIFASATVVFLWFCTGRHTDPPQAFPKRELVIFVMMVAVVTVHILRDNGYIT